MKSDFTNRTRRLSRLLDQLLKSAPLETPLPQEPGIYLLSEKGRPQYVGRTNDLRRRIRNHCSNSAGHNQASFAFRLARQKTGTTEAAYTREGSRAGLMTKPHFRMAFENAKERIRGMELRFVRVEDPILQALLEIYVALALGTPHNDFENH